MNHLEDVENHFKTIVYGLGEIVDNWPSPIKIEDGCSAGLCAKCCNQFALKIFEANSASLRLTNKMSCVYFSRENCGVSHEVTRTFSS